MCKRILTILVIGLLLISTSYPVSAVSEMTFYPDPDPETTSVDGYTTRNGGVSETFSVIRAGVGTSADDSSSSLTIQLFSDTAVDKYEDLKRGIVLFDTSALPDEATIQSAKLKLYVDSLSTGLGQPYIALVSSNPASDTSIISADFQALGTTRFATDITSFTNLVWIEFDLNGSGIGAIDETGISKYGLELGWDFDNSEPTWVSSSVSHMNFATGESGNDPELVITYSTEFNLLPFSTGTMATALGFTSQLFTDLAPALVLGLGLRYGLMYVIPKVLGVLTAISPKGKG